MPSFSSVTFMVAAFIGLPLSACKTRGRATQASAHTIVNARLACAEGLLAGGKRADALAIYQGLAKAAAGKPDAKAIELAATRGILACADTLAAAS